MASGRQGRWPANVILSPLSASILDTQSGVTRSGGTPKRRYGKNDTVAYGDYNAMPHTDENVAPDEGGASRYFLQAGYEPWELEWIYANGLRPCGEQPDTTTNS